MNRPFFTVLLPAFNARAHIRRALADLAAQTFRDFEVVVVDDGSTDGTGDIARNFPDPRVRVVGLSANRGLVGALNAGLEAARGEWVARMDADDRCRSGRLAAQEILARARPDVVLVYSRALLIDRRGLWRGLLRTPLGDAELRWDLCFRNAVCHSSAAFPLDLARDRLGGYRDMPACEDYDLWSRLLEHGTSSGTARPLVSYRNHAGSIMGRSRTVPSSAHTQALRQLMVSNLVRLGPIDDSGLSAVTRAWLQPAETDWTEYFTVREGLLAARRHVGPDVVADEDYTLLNRAADASPASARRMLDAIRTVCPWRWSALPRVRTTLFRISKGVWP